MRLCPNIALLCLALGLASAGAARGADAPPGEPARGLERLSKMGAGPAPASITLSGGASLGAYEAGALHYVLETGRANPGRFELKLVTGASAGALNGLIGIISRCGEGTLDPSDSLLWKVWFPLGFDDLFVPAEASKLGALSVRPLEQAAAVVERALEKGLPEHCDAVLGVTITRSEPRPLRTAGGRLALDRMEEKVAIRIRGRGPGKPPSVRNYVRPGDPLGGLVLVTDGDGEIALPALRDLLLASAAFPAAFPPRALRFCPARKEREPQVCLAADAEQSLFVDGGLLDNTPLRFAIRLASAGWERLPDGGTRWRDQPLARASGAARTLEDALFVFITPDIADYPKVEFSPQKPSSHSLATLLSRLVAGFVTTARSKELATLLEEQPELAAKVRVHQRHAPAASAPLAAFFGFFDRQLRAFDFSLGMYDAWKMVNAEGPRRLVLPERAWSPELPGWRAFACVRAVLEREEEAGALKACEGDAQRPLRILLQASLERLYGDCAAAPPEADTSANRLCEEARAGKAPPRVPGVKPLPPAPSSGGRARTRWRSPSVSSPPTASLFRTWASRAMTPPRRSPASGSASARWPSGWRRSSPLTTARWWRSAPTRR